jgi:hypothetical protein
MIYLAIYMPEWGEPRGEFYSKEDAEKFCQSRYCEPDCESCAAEWEVIEKDKYDKCEDFMEFLTGGLGMKVVYRRPIKCKKHPKYKGIKPPKDCPDCWKIYQNKKGL